MVKCRVILFLELWLKCPKKPKKKEIDLTKRIKCKPVCLNVYITWVLLIHFVVTHDRSYSRFNSYVLSLGYVVLRRYLNNPGKSSWIYCEGLSHWILMFFPGWNATPLVFVFPTQCTTRLIFDDARFKKIFLFFKIKHFTHPWKWVFCSRVLFWQANLS